MYPLRGLSHKENFLRLAASSRSRGQVERFRVRSLSFGAPLRLVSIVGCPPISPRSLVHAGLTRNLGGRAALSP